MKKYVVLLLMMAFSSVQADVYTWIDANGNPHYSDREPDSTHVNKVKVTTAPKPAPLPIDETAVIPLQYRDNEINCKLAVQNSYDGIDNMIRMNDINYRDGFIDKRKFSTSKASLNQLRQRISLHRCSISTGATMAFYRCMNDSRNHISHCSDKHNFH